MVTILSIFRVSSWIKFQNNKQKLLFTKSSTYIAKCLEFTKIYACKKRHFLKWHTVTTENGPKLVSFRHGLEKLSIRIQFFWLSLLDTTPWYIQSKKSLGLEPICGHGDPVTRSFWICHPDRVLGLSEFENFVQYFWMQFWNKLPYIPYFEVRYTQFNSDIIHRLKTVIIREFAFSNAQLHFFCVNCLILAQKVPLMASILNFQNSL